MSRGPTYDPELDLLEELSFMKPSQILDSLKMQETILRRLHLLCEIYENTFAGWKGVKLNEYLLREAVESCLCDIYRLKVFRGIQQEDEHKQAAFLVKWISKIRPVQVFDDSSYNVTSLLVNEIFAVNVALVILNIIPSKLTIKSQYVSNLLYLLHFHPCAVEQVASELYLLEKVCTLSTSP